MCSPRADLNALIHHALQAVQDCLPNNSELTVHNVEMAVVGPNHPFTVLSDQEVSDIDTQDMRPSMPLNHILVGIAPCKP